MIKTTQSPVLFSWVKRSFLSAIVFFTVIASSSCGILSPKGDVIVSVTDQKMAFVKEGKVVKTYAVSTSKFGLGDKRGSGYTPLGRMKVAEKIGGGAPLGSVFKGRQRTGEVIRPNAPGRDPIVTRIMWLKGTQFSNRNAYRRYIYIHGTPEERNIGKPASYGCIRMKSADIVDLYKRMRVGSTVKVVTHSLFVYKKDAAPVSETGVTSES